MRRKTDRYICLEKKLPGKLIRSGAARFEISLLRRLKHVNIVRYLDSYIVAHDKLHGPSASLYMEYCTMGSLADEIGKRVKAGRWFKELEIWDIFTQLVNGLAYIQYGLSDAVSYPKEAKIPSWISVVHRDIKPENIFLQWNPAGSPIVLLGDFGAAIQQDRHGVKFGKSFGMPGEWASPEWPVFSFASDIWLVGSVVQECCRLHLISSKGRVIFAGVGIRYSRHLNDAVAQFMQSDPSRRPRLDRWARNLASLREMMAGSGTGR